MGVGLGSGLRQEQLQSHGIVFAVMAGEELQSHGIVVSDRVTNGRIQGKVTSQIQGYIKVRARDHAQGQGTQGVRGGNGDREQPSVRGVAPLVPTPLKHLPTKPAHAWHPTAHPRGMVVPER